MIDPLFLLVEGGRHVEDRPAVLNRHHPSRREAAPVANALDVVDDRGMGIARQQKVTVQRVRQAAVHRPAGGHEGLGQDLAAEDALLADIAALAAEKVDLQRFKLQMIDQILHRIVRHSCLPSIRHIHPQALRGVQS